MSSQNRLTAFLASFFTKKQVSRAVPTCLLFWSIANHFLNQAVERAGGTQLLPFIVRFEYLTAVSYLSGVTLMLLGIGRDVTFKNVMTFNLEAFKPDTNRLYKAGFLVNRLGAFSLTYIIVILMIFGKSFSWFIWLLYIVDFLATAWFSFNLTRWIKQIGGTRAAPR